MILYKIRSLVLFLLLLPGLAYTQQKNEIQFIKGLSWKEIQVKAKIDNKFIFVDINATWCAPCRKMEKEVFTNKEVSDFYNSKFLSVSLQTDQTPKDDNDVKLLYEDAREISSKYEIKSIPTYLYFSPNGDLVHRSYGFRPVKEFLDLAKVALDPNANFATKKSAYYTNELSAGQKRDLSLSAYKLGEKAFADSVATDYYQTYLKSGKQAELEMQGNLDFIKYFYTKIGSHDSYFSLFFSKGKRMDSLFKRSGYSKTITKWVITNEEITKKLYDGKIPKEIRPDWDILEENIRKKYGDDRAKEIVLFSKYSFYTARKDWSPAIKSGFQILELTKDSSSMGYAKVNDFVWTYVVSHSNDPEDFAKGITWMEWVLKKYPNNIQMLDTYANLLYKAGQKEKAIGIEEGILNNIKTSKPDKYTEGNLKLYGALLEKMKAGLPTW